MLFEAAWLAIGKHLLISGFINALISTGPGAERWEQGSRFDQLRQFRTAFTDRDQP